jgi:vacuolar-type H+-ATPase subunit I/STV1
MKRILLIIAVLLLASSGRTGEVLKWVDERGVVHFTDNVSSVPEKYRGRIDLKELPEETEASTIATQPDTDGGDELRDRYGRGEDYWVKRASQIKNEMDRAQRNYERVRLEYNDLVSQYNATRSRVKRRRYQKRIESLRDELDQGREEIERAKEMWEKTLPQEAARAGAPADWVK